MTVCSVNRLGIGKLLNGGPGCTAWSKAKEVWVSGRPITALVHPSGPLIYALLEGHPCQQNCRTILALSSCTSRHSRSKSLHECVHLRLVQQIMLQKKEHILLEYPSFVIGDLAVSMQGRLWGCKAQRPAWLESLRCFTD